MPRGFSENKTFLKIMAVSSADEIMQLRKYRNPAVFLEPCSSTERQSGSIDAIAHSSAPKPVIPWSYVIFSFKHF